MRAVLSFKTTYHVLYVNCVISLFVVFLCLFLLYICVFIFQLYYVLSYMEEIKNIYICISISLKYSMRF